MRFEANSAIIYVDKIKVKMANFNLKSLALEFKQAQLHQ